MSLLRYSNYKDSGIGWLGAVPEHWRVERMKSALTIKKDVVGESSVDYLLLSLTLKGVIPRDMINLQGKMPADFDSYQSVEPRDLIFCLFDVEETPRAVGISSHKGMVTGAYTVASAAAGVCPEYVYYFYLSRDQYKALKMYYTGLRNVIRKEAFYSIPCPLPPYEEQCAIAAFLDRETGKIDALIAEQEKLLTLLAEKRQATISHAVTRGLNPIAPVKDSGVQWLAEVPTHWEVKSLKHVIASSKAGPFGSAITKDMYVSKGYRVYGQEQVIPAEFSKGDYYISEDKYLELQQYAVAPGDILISCVGTFGKIAIVPDDIHPGVINPRLIRLRVGNGVSAEFLVTVLRSLVTFEQFSLLSRGGTMDVINIGTLSSIDLAIPPYQEQLAIVCFVDREAANLDALKYAAEHAVALLKERRSTLIAAAVTGKIDVRQAA